MVVPPTMTLTTITTTLCEWLFPKRPFDAGSSCDRWGSPSYVSFWSTYICIARGTLHNKVAPASSLFPVSLAHRLSYLNWLGDLSSPTQIVSLQHKTQQAGVVFFGWSVRSTMAWLGVSDDSRGILWWTPLDLSFLCISFIILFTQAPMGMSCEQMKWFTFMK